MILISVGAVLLSIQVAVCFPLTIAYVFWKRATLACLAEVPFQKRVSVLVPAYNEEKTLRACVESLLASRYPDLEIIVIDDGSVDQTEQAIEGLVDGIKVRYVKQANAGKATALNRGAAVASGEVILFTDADSVFLPDTIECTVRWFADPTIDAVCGNDTPLHARTLLQKVLAVTSHIGTGFVRRALSLLGILPIISGNLGAVRTSVFRDLQGFRQIWGEDLEFTFRLQGARKRIIFDPSPIVRAECPSDLRSLWRQRIRWVRSYLKVSAMHADLFRPARAFPFSVYLPFNYFALTIVPILQIMAVPFLIHIAFTNPSRFDWIWSAVLYFGLLTFSILALYSVLLDRDFRTLRYLPVAFLLILPLSFFYSFVVLSSVWKEGLGRAENWEKIERLPSERPAGRGGISLALAGSLLLVAVGAASLSHTAPSPPSNASQTIDDADILGASLPSNHEVHDIAIATHFDDWHDWRDAINSVLRSPLRSQLRTVGISAGRLEWAHFRWRGHQTQWSAPQKRVSVDLLGSAIHEFNKRGLATVAIVDFYSPALLRRSQSSAAVRFDGEASTDQVCFSELVDGEYGRQVIEMVSYLSHHYSLNAIALTELDYHSFCFDDRCLRSYRNMTGRENWPKQLNGEINRDDPSIWQWRSAKMQAFLERVADAAHSGGKQLIVDVPVDWKDLHRHGKDSGLDYARVLQCADKIVVWNYFGVGERAPEISARIVRDLLKSFPSDRFFVSVGLWEGQHGTLDPQSFEKGLEYTMKGGAQNIWITPNKLMSQRHWSALDAALRSVNARTTGRN